MFRLVIADDEGKTTVVPLVRDEITIGRKEGNTIRLTERNVSRRHARLRKNGVGFLIEDLSSYNGVQVNGRRIEQETRLSPGDQVTIGDYLIALKAEAEVAAGTSDTQASYRDTPTTTPARLVMMTPPAPGAEFAITRSGMKIGRAEDLDIWVNHRSMSREHAEVRGGNGTFSIVDLDSANGMRVNGADTKEATLAPGDVVELGQVRFRYVGVGEHYAFEADRTIQMDAIPAEPPSSSSKAPLFAAIAIVALAVLIGGAIAMMGGDDADPVATTIPPSTVVTPPETAETAVPTPTPTPTGDPSPAVAACMASISAQRWDEAVRRADDALAIAPGHSLAGSCKQQAVAGQQALATFDRGIAALQAQRYADAVFAFDELPEDSAYRNRGEVQRSRDLYIEQELENARRNMRSNPEVAAGHANAVLTIAERSPEQEASATGILETLERQGTQVASVRPRRRRPRRSPTMDIIETPMVAEMTTMVVATPMMSRTSGGSAVSRAQACPTDNDYNRCVLRELRGNRSARGLMMQIEAHRNLQDVGKKRETIRRFIATYPEHPRASRYAREL